MLTEFFDLTNADIENQIKKNQNSLRGINFTSKVGNNVKGIILESKMENFYSSLSKYFSDNTGSDYIYDNTSYSSFISFKNDYLKFLKYNEQTESKGRI